MTTVREAVQKAAEVFDAVVDRTDGEVDALATELLFDAAEAVCKLLSPFVTSAEAEEDSGYDIESDDLVDVEPWAVMKVRRFEGDIDVL